MKSLLFLLSCHDHATLQGVIIPSAIWRIVFRHIFWVFNAVWALTSGGFRIVSDTLVDIGILSVRPSVTLWLLRRLKSICYVSVNQELLWNYYVNKELLTWLNNS